VVIVKGLAIFRNAFLRQFAFRFRAQGSGLQAQGSRLKA
jgi:hypothetical protein